MRMHYCEQLEGLGHLSLIHLLSSLIIPGVSRSLSVLSRSRSDFTGFVIPNRELCTPASYLYQAPCLISKPWNYLNLLDKAR